MTSEPLVPTPATRAIPAAPTRGPRRAPSITRVFTAAFLAIAVGVLADRYVTWQNARRTQADMVELTHRLERLERLHPSLGLETQLEELRELAADVGDNAIQSALQTTVILAIVLVALAIGLWYNRRRLAAPFGHIMRALERIAAGQYEQRVDERQPEELGMIAHSVNQMASALAWRERMQEHIGRLLTALNAPPPSAGGGSGERRELWADAGGVGRDHRCGGAGPVPAELRYQRVGGDGGAARDGPPVVPRHRAAACRRRSQRSAVYRRRCRAGAGAVAAARERRSARPGRPGPRAAPLARPPGGTARRAARRRPAW